MLGDEDDDEDDDDAHERGAMERAQGERLANIVKPQRALIKHYVASSISHHIAFFLFFLYRLYPTLCLINTLISFLKEITPNATLSPIR